MCLGLSTISCWIEPTFHPKTILDAGSNVGMSSLLFALFYPKAIVIAVEPQADNFDILQLNARRFGNIYAERKGLWSKDTFLDVSAPDHNDEFHSGTLHLCPHPKGKMPSQ